MTDARRTPWQLTRYLMRRALLMEVWGYVSIYRFVLRRPRVPRGARAFTYHRPVLPLIVVFIVVSTIELVVVDVLVRRWETVRMSLLVLGIWGLVWMYGLLFGFLTRPHAVGPTGLRLRSGAEIEVALAWDRIESVTRRKRSDPDKQPQVTVADDGTRVLHLHIQNETNVDVVLVEPVEARLPRGHETVSRIAVFVDDPEAFVAAAREHAPALRGAG